MANELKKEITFMGGIGLAVGNVVGSGLLGLPGAVIVAVGATNALWSWVITVALMAPMMFVFQRLATTYGESGGLAIYARAAFGKWAYTVAVVMLIGSFSLGLPALGLVGGAYFSALFGTSSKLVVYALAVLILVISVLFNLAGTRWITWFNLLSLYFVIGLVFLIIVLNWHLLILGVQHVGTLHFSHHLLIGITLVVWAFQGWENLSFGAEEFKEPKRDIPRVFGWSFGLVSLAYLLLAFILNGAVASC